MRKQRPKQLPLVALYGLLILVFVALVYVLIGVFSSPEQASALPAQGETFQSGFQTVTTGDTGQGNVEIALTPQGFVDNALRVSIAANTHSVDLSPFDLKRIVQLEYTGKTLRPVSAPSLSGHHASGMLVFEGVAEKQPFTIVITGIPGVERRVFTWS